MSDLARALETLVPPFDESGANWEDALRRGDERRRARPLLLAFAAALAVAAVLGATPVGQALVTGAFDRLSAWVDGAPGRPASAEERELVARANARSAAPIPDGTELGLLVSTRVDGVRYDLLGFRDRGSLCLRLRSSAGVSKDIVRAEADCVAEQLLVDLGKPVAAFSAADPFPRSRMVALYGLAADRASAVEVRGERSVRRVPVTNNAFLHVYSGEGPRLGERNRLDYRADVPVRVTALGADGRPLGSVRIMSLKRGYPAPPAIRELPGPVVIDHALVAPHVGWLDRGELRGEPYEWRNSFLPRMRKLHPNPATSLRVLVSRSLVGVSGQREPSYCLATLWPLSERPSGALCVPSERIGGLLVQPASAIPFDAQFPVYYGLVADGVESLELYLSSGARATIPIVDNVFALQAPVADPPKLVAYDAEHRVVAIEVISY